MSETSSPGFTIRSWDTNSGLPVNAVASISQDELGYIWITTYDGLARFDGKQFKVFNNQNLPGIHSNRFHSSIKDAMGNIWFYPEYGGVLKYSNEEFTFYDETNGFEGGMLTHHFVKHNGTVYFPTRNGLFKYTDAGFETVYQGDTSGLNYINEGSFYEDKILLTTNSGMVLTKNGETILHITVDDQSSFELYTNRFFGGKIFALHDGSLKVFDQQGNKVALEQTFSDDHSFKRISSEQGYLFLSSNNGLYVFEKSNPLKPAHHFPEFDTIVFNSFQDKSGNVWVRDLPGYIYQFQGDKFVKFNPDGMLDDHRFSVLFEDKDNNVWIGTGNKGLLKLSESVVESIDVEHGLPFGNSMNVFKDSRGNIWSGIRMHGLVKISPDRTVERFTSLGDIPLYDVISIAEGPDGSVFFHVLNHGVGRIYPDGRKELIRMSTSSLDTFITGIAIWNEKMITATRGGLFVHDMDGNLISHIDEESGLKSERIQKLKITGDGKAWLATINGGVSLVDLSSGAVQNYLDSDGLALNNVRGIYLDRYDSGTVWFTTEGNGISRFRDGTFASANSLSGIYDDMIHSITEDRHGKLWMSTNRGVFYVDKSELNDYLDGSARQVTSVVFGRNEGMKHEECNGGNTNSFYFGDDGRLYYPTQSGIAIFDTNNPAITTDRSPAPIVETINIRGDVSRLRDSLELEPGLNDFTITFTGLEFSNPERIRFKYKLEGYDKEWTYSDGMRTATYTNLPPRNYRFMVKASMGQFPDELEYASVDISLLPHFYQQWWFHLLIGLVFVCTIVFFHRLRVYQLTLRERKLEQTVTDRTRALNEEKEAAMKQQLLIEKQANELRQMNQTKDRFFNIIAHDLKGPVSGVKGLLELLSDEYDNLPDSEKKEFVYCMRESTDNVYELLNNLLSWARLQNKHTIPDILRTDAENAVMKSVNVLKQVASQKNIELDVVIEDNFFVKADQNMLDTILRNLISNAIKFSYPESAITITVGRDADSGYFSVRDTGTGISPEDQEKLFRPDSTLTTPGTGNEQGTGLGLLICQEMASAQNGKLSLRSQPGEGSVFTLRLPLAMRVEHEEKLSF